MTAWSPPRERAISVARELNWKSSSKPEPSWPTPMLMVAWMPEGLTTECTCSSSVNFSAFMAGSQCSSKMNTYLSRS